MAKDDYVQYQKRLNERGWAGVNWPSEYGGTGWSAVQKYIFMTEAAEAHAPEIIAFGSGSTHSVLTGSDNQVTFPTSIANMV